MATSTEPIRFFDIASGPPRRTFAPNPWKTRYALNFKGVSYQTEWVELPDVKSTRQTHGVAPVRKLPDGDDFYTLPFIHDPASNAHVGDSFDIALYLDETYTTDGGPQLIPAGTRGLHRAFNAQADKLFTSFIMLCVHGMPFNPDTAEQSRAEFVRRAGLQTWDDFGVEGDQRAKMLEDFKAALDEFSKCYTNDKGPFLEGDRVTYADFIVGGWLGMLKETFPEWNELCQWQGGRWKQLHDCIQKWAAMK